MFLPNVETEDPVPPVDSRQKTEAVLVDGTELHRTVRCPMVALREDLARAEAAHRTMQAADVCLRSGDDDALLALGFSIDHIADLRRRAAGTTVGYPAYALRNAKDTVRWLRRCLATLQAANGR